MPEILGFTPIHSSIELSNKWRTDGQAIWHNVDEYIVRAGDKYCLMTRTVRDCDQTHQNQYGFLPFLINLAHIPCTDPYICPHVTPSLHSRASLRHYCEVALAPSAIACPPTHDGPSTSPIASSCQAVRGQHVCGRAHSSPALPSAVYEAPMIGPSSRHHVVLSTSQTFESHTPRHARLSSVPKLAHPAFPRLCARLSILALHPLPVYHATTAPQLNLCFTAPLSTPPLQQK